MRTNIIPLAVFAASVSASPSPLPSPLLNPNSENHAFSLRSIARASTFDGPAALRKAYLKYDIEVPEHLQRRQATPSQGITGTVNAESERNDVEYLSPVSVGGKTLQLDFDTGSSDLWVFSSRLKQSELESHDYYAVNGSGVSSTAKPLDGLTWRISYGDGSGAAGIVFADRVTIGNVTATSQAVEAATSIASTFRKQSNDGILGLGFGSTNTIRPTRQKTWFENVKDSLAQPLFTVSLKKNATSVYDFGFVDRAKYSGELQYVAVNTSRGYWEFTATGYAVGRSDGSKAPIQPLSFQSIADTGTTLLLLPSVAASAYYAQVPLATNNVTEGGYVFPCSTSLPDFTLQVAGNFSITVPGNVINRGKSLTPGSQACYGGIQAGAPNLSIWGDVLLKSQFVVFDAGAGSAGVGAASGGPRLGFARQVPSVSVVGATVRATAAQQADALMKDIAGEQDESTAHPENAVTVLTSTSSSLSSASSAPAAGGLVLPGNSPPRPSPSPIFMSMGAATAPATAAKATATSNPVVVAVADHDSPSSPSHSASAKLLEHVVLTLPESAPKPDNAGGVVVPLSALLPASVGLAVESPHPERTVGVAVAASSAGALSNSNTDLRTWATAGIPPSSLTGAFVAAAVAAVATDSAANDAAADDAGGIDTNADAATKTERWTSGRVEAVAVPNVKGMLARGERRK